MDGQSALWLARASRLSNNARVNTITHWSARFAICALVLGGAVSPQAAEPASLKEASQLEQQGRFKEAAALLQQAVADPALTAAERQEAKFELDRLGRIRQDYPSTRETLYAALQNALAELTREEFDQWLAEGRFDRRTFDGEERFMVSSVSNLFFRYPDLAGRRKRPAERAAYQQAVWQNTRAIRAAVEREQTSYVLPTRFICTMTLTVKPDVVPTGETIRCWLPIPGSYPFQRDIAIRFSQPLERQLADEFSPIRSVYLEQPAAGSQPTVFSVDYAYTASAIRFDVQPKQARPAPTDSFTLRRFLEEAPHVVSTPEMRALADEIAGKETNPATLARRYYDWVSTNIQYSFAHEYSTIRNLGAYCLTNRHGDCGQAAFLFMTLCRLSGIPARWQSGWFTFPEGQTIHDWCEIYLAPWGWVPVDPYMGMWAAQYASHLDPAQQQEVRDFYFGGLDQYRMVANSDHSQPLWPEKRSLRADPVDFQRGELEAAGKHLYFGQFTYDLLVTEVPPILEE